MPGDKVLRFKTPYDAYEHCQTAIDAWHPLWQAALRSGDLRELKALEERFRHRVLAVYPRDAYAGSWAMINANFAYRLSELSEFDQPLEHISEARALYQVSLPGAAPDWHNSLRASYEHSYAEILLRYAEVSTDRAALNEAAQFCERVIERDTGDKPRALATLGAVHRRIAERDRSLPACEIALDVLRQADSDQTPENGDLSWALQRQTLAAALLLSRDLGGSGDLTIAQTAIDEALTNYALNPHGFWIRPSRREDAIKTKARIEQGYRP